MPQGTPSVLVNILGNQFSRRMDIRGSLTGVFGQKDRPSEWLRVFVPETKEER